MARSARIVLWSLGAVIGVIVIAGIVLALSFDPDSLKPRIIAAVKQATGRDLSVQGPIRLGLSLQPTLVAQGVSLANPPGFSRPQLMTLDELDLKLALLPLLRHRVEIDHLVLVKPDILLETNGQGQSNWHFTPEASDTPAAQPASAKANEKVPTEISVAEVRVDDGTLAWRDDRIGRNMVLGITTLRAAAPSADADMHVRSTATYNGAPFTLDAVLGPLARLQDATASTPWPAKVQLEAAGSNLIADGTIAQPLVGRGYMMKTSATIPDLAALAPFLPGQPLPALRQVGLTAQIADTGASLPAISDLSMHVGPSDLGSLAAGLKLEKLDVAASAPDQPVKIAGQGSFGGSPVTLTGTIGVPSVLIPGGKPGAPLPLDISMQALGSNLNVKGSVGSRTDGHPAIQAELTADKIDADALRAAVAQTPAARAATPPAAPAPAPKRANATVIPDAPISFSLLQLADADAKLRVDQLKAGGALYHAIDAHIVLHGGKLQADPVAADLPEGHVTGSLSADAAEANPPVAFRVRIPALALHQLLATLGEPEVVNGTLDVQADLHGVGATPHAIASTMDGSFSVSMGKGTVDNRLLGSTLGSVLREINLLDLVGRGGSSEVECFVANAAVARGVATFRSLGFASSLLTMDGGGSMNLANETLDLRIRPQARLAGTGIVVPLKITGPWRSPASAPDPTAAVTQNAGTVAGAVLGQTNPLGAITGALGGKQVPGGSEAGCGSPHTGGGAAAPTQQAPKTPNVGNVLKQLFR